MKVIELQDELRNILKKLLPGSKTPVALIDFPNHLNVGDNVIWLGEIALLKELGFKISYICTASSYCKSQLRKVLKNNGIIILHGGGNFGDLWMRHENLRRTVVRDFPSHRIIQLPQSIYYESKAEIEITKEVLNNHNDLTLLTRDQKSLAFAKAHFTSPSLLCPDLAFGLMELIKPSTKPKYDILWLIRGDREIKINAVQPQIENRNETVTDWSSGYHSRIDTLCSGLFQIVKNFPSSRSVLHKMLLWSATRAAQKRMDYGIKLLSRGKVIITDRLHGHITCFILGIPHVALDNSYGKVSGFMETWGTADEVNTHFASNGEEAHRLAEKLSADL